MNSADVHWGLRLIKEAFIVAPLVLLIAMTLLQRVLLERESLADMMKLLAKYQKTIS